MSLRTLRTTPLFAAWFLGGLFVARSSSAACDDKAKFLSEEYLLNKGDCAVNKALDAGEGLLMEAGKSAAKALLNYYLPGVGSFLFGGGGDPFAADAAMIVNEIQESKVAIMRAIVDQALIGDGATWDSISNGASDWANPFYDVQTKIDNLSNLDSLIADLTTLRNRFETTNYGVWNLDAYAVAVQMELSLKADRETLRMFDQGQRNGDDPDEILANTQGAIQYAWANMLNGAGQVFSYLNSLDMQDFTETSNTRFVDVVSMVPIVVNLCGYEAAYRKYNVKTTAHPTMPSPKIAYEVGLNAYGCVEPQPLGMVVAQTSSYLWTGTALTNKTHLAQSNSTGSVWQVGSGGGQWSHYKAGVTMVYNPQAPVNATLDFGHNKHKADEALLYFVAGYGSVRPLLDRWKDAIGEGQNEQANNLDTSLKNYINNNFPAFAMTQGYFFPLATGSSGTPVQKRWSENYFLALGLDEFTDLLITTGIDTLGVSADKYDRYLRNYTSAADAAADQQANFAAKVPSTVLL
jgi:hypothetical protein